MASYKSGFDPPTRPQENSRARRLGTYMQQNAGKQERIEQRESDMDSRRTATVGRSQQTIPRPRIRDPSPSTRPKLEGSRIGSNSNFAYSRGTTKTTISAGKPPPELRGKSSRNVLRRKPSSVAQDGEASRPKAERQNSSSSTRLSSERKSSVDATRSAEAYNEIFTRPPRTRTPAARESPQIYPELDRYRTRPEQTIRNRDNSPLPPKLSTQDLPPPTPLLSGTPGYSAGSSRRYSGYSGSGYSASPSTRFSESPGPGGAYSRDTTPTSMSSQSPGIIAPMKTTTPRLRQASPALNRPPVVTRRRAASIELEVTQGLPSLRESVTSSSSNSTVKGDGKGKEKKKKKRLSPMPPSPPPRKSSQKFKKAKGDEIEESPSKSSSAPAKPVMMSPTESPAKSIPTIASPGPPRRPSRDGTPDLHTQLGNIMPIVQSNLTNLPPQSRRQSSLPMPRGTSPQLSNHPIRPQGSRIPSRNPSPSPVLLSREATPAPPSGLGIIPDLRPQQPSSSRLISRTPSPSISSTKPRFGLFSRRTKTVPDVPQQPRKGPAAGTGHEGYGKYAAATRGRSSSAGTISSSRKGSISLSISGSTSQESVSSTKTNDPFLLHRMSPVIIAGGGEIIENRNEGAELMRTESGTSILLNPQGRPSLDSKTSPATRTTLWPSPFAHDVPNRTSLVPSTKARRPSDSSDDGSGIGKRTLAYRRSQRFDPNNAPLTLPRPLNFRTMSSSTTSLDASILSDDTTAEIGTARKATLTKPRKLEKKVKEKEGRKWNFFHRSQPKDVGKEKDVPVVMGQVMVDSGMGRAREKVVPHYALLDSSDEMLDGEVDLEGLLRDVEVVGMSNEELDLLQFGAFRDKEPREEGIVASPPIPEPVVVPEEHQPRPGTPPAHVLFSSLGLVSEPPAPIFSSPEPIHPLPQSPPQNAITRPKTPPHLEPQTSLHLSTNAEKPRIRPSRLPQVGRIPKVVSARPETTSPKSFSRPFARLSISQPLMKIEGMVDEASVALGASPPKQPSPELHQEEQQSQAQPQPQEGIPSMISRLRQRESSSSKSSSLLSNPSNSASNHKDFLSFSPTRKNSETTTTSSSGGQMSFSDTIAVVPNPEDPLVEDELWDEYDDLIPRTPGFTPNLNASNFDIGNKTPLSATSSLGYPFQYESYETRRMRLSKLHTPAKESPTLVPGPLLSLPPPSNLNSGNETAQRRSALTSSSVYSVDMSARLKEDLKGVPSPSTPLSFSDFFEGYGDRNLSMLSQSQLSPRSQIQHRRSSLSQYSSRSLSRLSKSLSGPIGVGVGLGLNVVKEEYPHSSEHTEKQGNGRAGTRGKGPENVNLRVASMTVSRWLTFGQVLFSPIDNGEKCEVLVVDGLGNDDWSFYAAETYPTATFYNLSPTHPPSNTSNQPSTPSLLPTPSNHHQIHFSPTTPTTASQPSNTNTNSHPLFPFKKATFDKVIYRFPSLTSHEIYTHTISECARVLKPGGYLEFTVLDLDMVNMGPLTRHSLRGLKTSLSTQLSGQNPRSGNAGNSRELYLGSASDLIGRELGTGKGWKEVKSCVLGVPVGCEIPYSGSRSGSGSGNEGLGDLLRKSTDVGGNGEGGGVDRDITKMVARVGRWWWGRCYDLYGNGEGVFDEKNLEECEGWRSSFKLFVGVARKGSISSGGRRGSVRGDGSGARAGERKNSTDGTIGAKQKISSANAAEKKEPRANRGRRPVPGRGKGMSF